MSFKKILVLDNFDSFTFNLVDFFRIAGCSVEVLRNDLPPAEFAKRNFELLVLSPGPSTPRKSRNLLPIIKHFATKKPIFGVCLGLEALLEFFGGSLKFVPPVHGKSSPITHDGRTIFTGLPPNFLAGRYHSLAANCVPKCFQVSAQFSAPRQSRTAHSKEALPMAIRHTKLPIEAVQFHPESVLSMSESCGQKIVENVVAGKFANIK